VENRWGRKPSHNDLRVRGGATLPQPRSPLVRFDTQDSFPEMAANGYWLLEVSGALTLEDEKRTGEAGAYGGSWYACQQFEVPLRQSR